MDGDNEDSQLREKKRRERQAGQYAYCATQAGILKCHYRLNCCIKCSVFPHTNQNNYPRRSPSLSAQLAGYISVTRCLIVLRVEKVSWHVAVGLLTISSVR